MAEHDAMALVLLSDGDAAVAASVRKRHRALKWRDDLGAVRLAVGKGQIETELAATLVRAAVVALDDPNYPTTGERQRHTSGSVRRLSGRSWQE